MFQFPRLPPEVRPKPFPRSHRITGVGLPHSGILGSKLVRSSPRHIAVHRALHRLFAPRHPPVALGSLTVCSQRMSLTLRSHCSLPRLAGKPASPRKANKARLYSLMHTQIIRSAVFKAPRSFLDFGLAILDRGPGGPRSATSNCQSAIARDAPSGMRRRGFGISPPGTKNLAPPGWNPSKLNSGKTVAGPARRLERIGST